MSSLQSMNSDSKWSVCLHDHRSDLRVLTWNQLNCSTEMLHYQRKIHINVVKTSKRTWKNVLHIAQEIRRSISLRIFDGWISTKSWLHRRGWVYCLQHATYFFNWLYLLLILDLQKVSFVIYSLIRGNLVPLSYERTN